MEMKYNYIKIKSKGTKIFWFLTIFVLILGCLERPETITESQISTIPPPEKKFNNMTHQNLVDALTSPSGTTAQKEAHLIGLDQLNNEYFTWTLVISDVTSKSIIFNIDGDQQVILYMAEDQKSKLLSLKAGDSITIEGMPVNIRNNMIGSYYTKRTPNRPAKLILGQLTMKDGRIID